MTTAAETEALDAAAAWLGEGRKSRWGRWLRPGVLLRVKAGSQIAVRDDGAFVGSVSGGCIEGAVIAEALTAMEDRKVRTLEFGVSDETAWSVGLACGGRIEIFVEPVH